MHNVNKSFLVRALDRRRFRQALRNYVGAIS